MCQLCPVTTADPVDLLLADVRGMESRLGAMTYVRRRDRSTAQTVKRITEDLRYIMRREQRRVEDILTHYRLPYVPGARGTEAAVDPRIFLNAFDVSQYEAVLIDDYTEAMPHGFNDAQREILDAAGKRYKANSTGELFLAKGVKLLRFRGAEQWVRDHAIQFGRRWASGISDKTNKAIRSQLADGFAKFESIDELRKRVRTVYADATTHRAEMIARTETNRAYNAAQNEMAARMAVGGKYWILSGSPYSYVDVCADNANLGIVPVASMSFTDMDGTPIMGPPAHPNCMCSAGYEVADDWQIPQEMIAE